jgi:hypothetical protein
VFDEDYDEFGRRWDRYWCDRHECYHTCYGVEPSDFDADELGLDPEED